MEKTGNKHIEDFPPAILYLNDLQEILGFFEKTCEEVTLETGPYNKIKPSEITDLAKELRDDRFENLYIIGRNPYVNLELRTYGARAYVSESSPVQLGLIAQVRELLVKRKKKYFKIMVNIFHNIPSIVGLVLIILDEWALAAISFALSFLLIWPVTKYQMSRTIEVYTKPDEQRKSFFFRKQDEIIIAISSAFLGALFSWVLMKYFGHV